MRKSFQLWLNINSLCLGTDNAIVEVGRIACIEPLEVVKCKKCGKLKAQPKELIRIYKVKWNG